MSKKQKTSTRFLKIHPEKPGTEIITEAARIIQAGGVVVFPTRNLYGLAADAFNPRAVQSIFGIKRRRTDKPLLVLIKSRETVTMLADAIPPAASFLMDFFWPGRITIVIPAGPSINATLTGGTGRIGIRMPGHPVAAALVKAVDNPVTGTSANISGNDGCSTVADLDPEIAKAADLVLDAGLLKLGKGSTVVDARKDGVRILREGAISRTELQTVLQQNGFKMIDNAV